MNNHHYYYKKKGRKMQEITINITEEMKTDAINLLNVIEEFNNKYGFKMVSVDNFTIEKKVAIYGDNDETGGFNAYYIYPNRQVSERYIKGDIV